MSTVELKVKESMSTVGYFEKEKKEPIKMDKEPEVLSDQEDYLVKSLRRVP